MLKKQTRCQLGKESKFIVYRIKLRFSKSATSYILGDVIQVYRDDLSGWWRGKNERTGLEGLFPSNFVEPLLVSKTKSRSLAIKIYRVYLSFLKIH